VGAGGSLEAAYSLGDPIPAGTWRLVADGIILEVVDVRFEILLRRGDGSEDIELASFEHHFEPLPGGAYEAQPYEATADVVAVEPAPGDQLIFRYSGESASMPMAYIPNGDGELTGGRIPFIELPR
jgi:hypothetical protein